MKNWITLIIGAVACAMLLMTNDLYWLRLGTMLAMYCVMALSWNFIGGMAGYPSFATAAFFGVGAYVSAVSQSHGLDMTWAWVFAGVLACIFATLIGLPILRLKGHYFAIASLAIVEILRELVNTNEDLTGGGMGMNLPLLKMAPEAQAQLFFAAMLGLTVLTTACTLIVHHGRLGFAFRCIEQNEDAAVVLGVDARFYKTIAFALSAFFPAVAGAIYGNWVQYIEPQDVFDVLHSVKPLVMVLLGGVGTPFGPILGASAFLLIEEVVWRNFLTAHTAVLGAMIVGLVLFLPGGFMTVFKRLSTLFVGAKKS